MRIAERALRDGALVAKGDVVLCACSGGPDSSALLHVLARLRGRLGFELVAHGVDHGLRPEAARELALAASLARSLDVPFDTTAVVVAPGGNLQARAREARMAALAAAARRAGACRVALAHTADDRAETLLLRLLRGSGPAGLAVMPPRAPVPFGPGPSDAEHAGERASPAVDAVVPGSDGALLGARRAGTCDPAGSGARLEIIRPLVAARRDEVLAHLARHGIPYASDPSNADPRFARVRVRRELLPLLTELSPRIVEHLCALADMLDARFAPETPEAPAPGLGRAQRVAIERARRLGRRSIRLRVRGGAEVEAAVGERGIGLAPVAAPAAREGRNRR